MTRTTSVTTRTRKASAKAAATADSKNIIVSKIRAKRTGAKAPRNGALYLDKDAYKSHIDGLMAQGLEHRDAVNTLKIGLRQANGFSVPLALTMHA